MGIFDFEGFGASVTGGAGGTVYTPSTWADMKTALEASGTRIIRFSGDITATSQANVSNDNFTLEVPEGQYGQIITDGTIQTSSIRITCNNFIIRRVAFRNDPSSTTNSTGDCLNLNGATNGMITRCSFFWSNDEELDFWDETHDITVQWCIFAEPLDDPYTTTPHAFCFLIGSPTNQSYNISVHHNLFASYRSRGPRFADADTSENICNVMYNSIGHATDTDAVSTNVDLVKNLKVPGPDDSNSYVLQISSMDSYYSGNDSTDAAETEVSGSSQASVGARQNSPATPVTEESDAFEVRLVVLANAGTGDVSDQRIIQDVINGTGAVIDQPEDAADGGWQDLSNDLSFNITSIETTVGTPEMAVVTADFYEAGTKVHTEDFRFMLDSTNTKWTAFRAMLDRFIAANSSGLLTGSTTTRTDAISTDTDDPDGWLADDGMIAMTSGGGRLMQTS